MTTIGKTVNIQPTVIISEYYNENFRVSDAIMQYAIQLTFRIQFEYSILKNEPTRVGLVHRR